MGETSRNREGGSCKRMRAGAGARQTRVESRKLDPRPWCGYLPASPTRCRQVKRKGAAVCTVIRTLSFCKAPFGTSLLLTVRRARARQGGRMKAVVHPAESGRCGGFVPRRKDRGSRKTGFVDSPCRAEVVCAISDSRVHRLFLRGLAPPGLLSRWISTTSDV